MLFAKTLKKIALPGLTFGEHCENTGSVTISSNFYQYLIVTQLTQ